MLTILSHVRYGARVLAASPAFTLTTVLSIALGVSATTAIFSLADALLLRAPAGVAAPGRLVEIARSSGGGVDNFSYPVFADLRDGARTVQSMAAVRLDPQAVSLGGQAGAERVFASLVSGTYFDVLGVRPRLGRTFSPDEDRIPGERPVVVISHAFWQARFQGDPGALGSTIVLNGQPFAVIGVTPEGFAGHTFVTTDMWVPIAMEAVIRGEPGSEMLTNARAVWLTSIARLADGVTVDQTRDEMTTRFAAIQEARPDVPAQHRIRVDAYGRVPAGLRLPLGAFLGLLFAITGLVLLVACSNVAGMLLARAEARRREVATRLALGASRGRLVGQLLTETGLLFATAAVVGTALAVVWVRALDRLLPALPIPIALDFAVDLRALGFALAISGVTSLVFGLAPARSLLRVDVAASLHGHGATADRTRTRLRQLLVGGQVAAALTLLVVTGLLVRALDRAATIDTGFDTTNVQVVSLDTRLAGARDAATVALVDRLLERVAAIDGVESAATARMIPLQGGGFGLGGLRVPGVPAPGDRPWHSADWDVVSPSYFETLRLPIVEGRAFTAADRDGAPPVVIVNETFARQLWPGQSAIGRVIYQQQGLDDTEGAPLEVVGVARDGKYRTHAEAPRSFVYVPVAQQPQSHVELYVRHREGRTLGPELRAAIAEVEPALPILGMQSFEAATAIGLLQQLMAAWVSGLVGVTGSLLAAIGLYGLMAFLVARRTREIAVRMALGASRSQVLRMMLGQAGRLA
ncbi:MAG: ABC transporter permease, partial [Vicinamibacteria bacterium]